MASSILLGLGTNLGDRLLNLRTAIARLEALLGPLQISSVYESPALLKEGSPAEWNRPYLNMAAKADCPIAPGALLTELKTIEMDMGRLPDAPTWSPRVIDIDILSHGESIIESSTLILPHPHIASRPFVLMPMMEIAPDWKHTLSGQSILQMLSQQPIGGTERIGEFAA